MQILLSTASHLLLYRKKTTSNMFTVIIWIIRFENYNLLVTLFYFTSVPVFPKIDNLNTSMYI